MQSSTITFFIPRVDTKGGGIMLNHEKIFVKAIRESYSDNNFMTFLFTYRYELLNVSQKQSKSLGDLLEMVSS